MYIYIYILTPLGNINTVPGNVMSIAMSIPLPSIYIHIH